MRYRKQILFNEIGESGQQQLLNSKALVVGCGALGSVIAESLVRAGVGTVRLVDRDFVEISNLQRQVLYDEADVAAKLPKAVAAERKLKAINSSIEIEAHVADVTSLNILQLMDGVDCVVDGTDNFETRFLINDAAVETNTPWVHGGCVGSHGQVMTIIPGQTPCWRCLMPETPEPGSSETCDTAGVIGPAVNIIASLQVVGALKILSGQRDKVSPELLVVDVWDTSLRKLSMQHLMEQRNCPCCTHGERLWLHGDQGAQTTVLCGRNSVQISPAQRTQLSLPETAARLRESGTVQDNPFLITFRPDDCDQELTIFSDGRAIVSETEDMAVARSLYARYIGL